MTMYNKAAGMKLAILVILPVFFTFYLGPDPDKKSRATLGSTGYRKSVV